MDKESMNGKMEANMMEILMRIKGMGKERLLGQMENNMKVNG